ncbi:MAG: hypothetical protein K8S98_00325 [Planctomycetes bacterium]|nr:hypothetical protein [Planctomycetota bacterium]
MLATLAAIAALVRLILTDRVFGTGPISIGLQVAAAAFMLWARITFGRRSFHAAANPTQGELVTHGPYALVRNPIYLSVIVFTWAAVATHLGVETVLLGLAITAGMVVRALIEERLLRAAYPAYADYARRVRRFVPFVF